jgi:hypothetical protein
MKKAIPAKQKPVGRPATGITPMMGFRAEPALRAAIVRWAENQPDMPTLSEATRRLVELGLGSVKVARAQKRRDSPTARDLAAVQIDRLADSGVPAEEQASRKRHLLKGPEEFREARIDRPKRKT